MSKNVNTKKRVKFYETWKFIFLVCVLLPICFRTFLYSPRHIPSSSMKPTLLIGDYIFISKFSYGYSKYSLPFGHAIDYFDDRIFFEEPEIGDVIVFRPPNALATDYIKRLVGKAGDTVQMVGGKLKVNGSFLPVNRIDDFIDKKQSGEIKSITRYQETLPNGVTYEILDERKNGPADNTIEYTVPDGHYFFVGDNRDNSSDSRMSIGFVPQENLIGRAEVVLFSNESKFRKIWDWVVSFRDDRLLVDLKE